MHAQEAMLGPPAVQIPRLVRSVGPCWHAVLYRLHGQLVALCPGYPALGVKEKFGGLRVQVNLGERAAREAAEPLLRAAERMPPYSASSASRARGGLDGAMTYRRGGSRRCATTVTAPGPPARSCSSTGQSGAHGRGPGEPTASRKGWHRGAPR